MSRWNDTPVPYDPGVARGSVPVPPPHLAERVGSPPTESYERRGLDLKKAILGALPGDWSFDGKRVLDFGCGPGRVLRHFRDEAATAEIWGCDMHDESIRWVQRHLCPPIRAFRNDPEPPLPIDAGTFDLIWALSVFTHIGEAWSAWLLELHRVLRPDGMLLATFLGEGHALDGEPWDEDVVGMNVRPTADRFDSLPVVQHSPWWLRAHWGRAFDILDLEPSGFGGAARSGQGWVLLRKKPVELTPADLERWEVGEPREQAALSHRVRQLERQIERLHASTSWRVTEPLRRARHYLSRLPRRTARSRDR